jgi:hypothetical protein
MSETSLYQEADTELITYTEILSRTHAIFEHNEFI